MDAIEWMNQELKDCTDPLEAASMILNQANTIIAAKTSQLQLLEKEFLCSLPSVTSQLQDLQSKTLVLQDKCNNCIIDPEEHPELNELFMLDTIVSRMETTKNALQEVEKWASFSIEMDAIFDSGEYEKAGQRLKDASESLDLLSVTVEYEERKKILEEFQIKLEEHLHSNLVQNYLDQDVEKLGKNYELYKCIHKQGRFMQILNEKRAQKVMEEWYKFDIGMYSTFEMGFVKWNSDFLTTIVFESLVSEANWILNIIPNAYNFQMDYLGNVFAKVGPLFQDRMMTMYEKDNSLDGIKDLYEACVSFGSSAEKYLLPLESSNTIDICDSGKWGLDIYKSFMSFQVNYANYERKNALEYLSVAISDNRKAKNYLVCIN